MLPNMTFSGQYGELSMILAYLDLLSHVQQTAHWVSKGDPYYGDHLLFERLYNETNADIDGIAEKLIGLGDVGQVDLTTRLRFQLQTLQSMPIDPYMDGRQLASVVLEYEKQFLVRVSEAAQSMKMQGLMTRGLDNLLAGIEDKHEGFVYLLKQRLS